MFGPATGLKLGINFRGGMHTGLLLLVLRRGGFGDGRGGGGIRSGAVWGRSWAQVMLRFWSVSVTLKRFSGVGSGCEAPCEV